MKTCSRVIFQSGMDFGFHLLQCTRASFQEHKQKQMNGQKQRQKKSDVASTRDTAVSHNTATENKNEAGYDTV